MTLTIHLPDEQEAALKAEAHAEEFAQQVLAHELASDAGGPLWEGFTRRVHSLPEEVFERLPSDAASEHDHYF